MPDTTHAATAVTYVLPTASDQLSSALNAPIPFFFAVVAVAIALAIGIWRAFEWRYGGIIEMTRTMIELANKQAESAKTLQTAAEATVTSLNIKLKEVEKYLADAKGLQKDQADAKREEASLKLIELSKMAVAASEQWKRASQANDAVTDSLSRIPTIIRTYAPTVVQRPSSLDAIAQSGGNWPPPTYRLVRIKLTSRNRQRSHNNPRGAIGAGRAGPGR